VVGDFGVFGVLDVFEGGVLFKKGNKKEKNIREKRKRKKQKKEKKKKTFF